MHSSRVPWFTITDRAMSRILIVAPHWVGDAVMSLGLVQALRQRDPAVSIGVLRSKAGAGVYRASAAVDEVIEAPFVHGALQWRLRRQLAYAIKRRPADQQFTHAIVLPNSFKTALIPYWAGIRHRTGYAVEGRSPMLTERFPKPSKKNKPQMLAWYGRLGGFADDALPLPVLQVDVASVEALRSRFDIQLPYMAVAPGAEYGPAKRWPAKHFAQTITHILHNRIDGVEQCLIVGGPKDVEVASHVIAAMPADLAPQVVSLAGQTTLDEAIAAVAGAQIMITNDSGLMHVAAACGVRVEAVFGSSDPRHTPPMSATARIHWLQLPCSPCFERECPLGHLNCLNQLSAEQVCQGLSSINPSAS